MNRETFVFEMVEQQIGAGRTLYDTGHTLWLSVMAWNVGSSVVVVLDVMYAEGLVFERCLVV